MAVASGSRERWRFVNAANGRYFNLELPGHTFNVIAWDSLLAPKDTAQEIITKMYTEISHVLKLPEERDEETGLSALERGQFLHAPGLKRCE